MKNVILIFCLIAGSTCQVWSQVGQIKQPNIIFILMDDMGYGDLGVFFQKLRQEKAVRNEPWILTPNLDRMAAEGAILPHHYAASPVCAPSRASILLGVNQGHANVRDNQFDKALEDDYTLGNVLQKAGYRTAAIGKWGLQGDGEGPGWPAHPLKRGFDYYFGYMAHVDGHEHYPKEGVYKGSKEVWENYNELSNDLDKCYTGDLFTAIAKRYIMEHQQDKAGQPFFMYLAYDTPHAVLELPTQAYPKGGGLHGGIQWLGAPGHMINTASGTVDSYMYPQYATATYDDDNNTATPEVPWPDTYKRYASVNCRIDEQVADILQLLKDLKIDDNTFVVFTSDNGTSAESYLPEPYRPDFFQGFGPFDGIKRDLYEGGVRVPAIAWWPGVITPHTVVNTPNISYDWLPTFAEAAGFAAPVRSDGVSLLASLTKKGKQGESRIYAEYFHPGTMPRYTAFRPEHRGKRRGQMQMVHIDGLMGVRYNIQSAEDDFEIYDVVNDPQQARNLAKEHPVLQQQMKDRVLQMRFPDTSAARPYDYAPVPSLGIGEIDAGKLKAKSYRVHTPWVPQIQGLEPTSVMYVNNFTEVPEETDMIVFEGYIHAPADGEYTFYLSTDHKAFVRIHDIGLIDADYGYSPGQEKQSKLKLRAGYHPVRIYYRTIPGNSRKLQFQWSYEGGPRIGWR